MLHIGHMSKTPSQHTHTHTHTHSHLQVVHKAEIKHSCLQAYAQEQPTSLGRGRYTNTNTNTNSRLTKQPTQLRTSDTVEAPLNHSTTQSGTNAITHHYKCNAHSYRHTYTRALA
ncbi:unnamed protein product [Ceratitis capitata]|uniref:(Mediterranean fruit fly) hypothetical protein n=1 Tax=Ceratitis capitata TaxID=7213 RepID=A0A811U579_CERCA|nr:unnamed protein product [Ceratitis capitata]